jgi:hypothetical protein
MIPLFLVPYAIFSPTLSALNYAMPERKRAGDHEPNEQVEGTR